MHDLRKILDLIKIFAVPKDFLKSKNYCTMIPQVDLFSFVFLEKLKTPKRNFEIKWPLGCTLRLVKVLISLVGWDTYLLAIGIPSKFCVACTALVVSLEYRCRYIGDLLRITSRSVSNACTAGTRWLTAQPPFTTRASAAPTCIQIVRSFVTKRK